MLHETRVLLSLIYRDYICTPEEKQRLLEKDEEVIKKEEEVLREKYNVYNIFEQRRSYETKELKEDQNQIITYKESLFKRILNIIKRLFNR